MNVHSNNFDLIRLVAASQVMVLHIVSNLQVEVGPLTQRLLDALSYFPGVPIFFVISGFLVSSSLERSASLRNYARKRFLRIYPGLFACTIVTFFCAMALSVPSILQAENSIPLGKWLLAQLTIFQFYVPTVLKSSYGVGHWNGSLWTIPVEMQFYAALPLIYLALRYVGAHAGWVMFALIAGSYGASLTLNSGSELQGTKWEGPFMIWRTSVAPYLYMFLLGVIAHQQRARFLPWLRGRLSIWLAIYVAISWALDGAAGIQPGGNTPNPVSMLLLAMCTLSAAFTAPTLSQRVLRNNDISYGTYIYHMVVANALFALTLPATSTTLVLAIVLTYSSAWLSWRWIERPALMRKEPAG